MTPRRDALRAGSHWHVDCRIEGELPKDTGVSGRFLATILLGAVTCLLALIAGWFVYQNLTLGRQVADLDQRLSTSMPEVRVIQKLQREYVAEASKVDQAYGTIRPALVVSEFIAVLSRTLPREISLDSLEWSDSDLVTMRGQVRKESSRILEQYVEQLKKDPVLAAQFSIIRQADYDHTRGRFAISFRLQPLPPL